MPSLPHFLQNLRDALLIRLETPYPRYQHRIFNNMDYLYRFIRKGDVILVEGRSKMSSSIKLFSQSHWSHVAYYVGDELVKHHPRSEYYVAEFGVDARHLLIEAFSGQGVVASPLRKYQTYNLRVCRPFKILPEDQQSVTTAIIDNLGKRYDQQNIIDIALMLLPLSINPLKRHSIRACLGNCDEYEVICSGMIAQAFQRVSYPIVPGFKTTQPEDADFQSSPYGADLIMRHFSQILPRDFDLSPNFDIIKFNIIETGDFDYKALRWHQRL